MFNAQFMLDSLLNVLPKLKVYKNRYFFKYSVFHSSRKILNYKLSIILLLKNCNYQFFEFLKSSNYKNVKNLDPISELFRISTT